MIYAVQQGAHGPVKVGSTTNLTHRLRSLQTASPVRLVLLGTWEGGALEEAAIHAEHDAHRLEGEWFAPQVAGLLADRPDKIDVRVGRYAVHRKRRARVAPKVKRAAEELRLQRSEAGKKGKGGGRPRCAAIDFASCKGLTRRQIAEKCGVSEDTVSRQKAAWIEKDPQAMDQATALGG